MVGLDVGVRAEIGQVRDQEVVDLLARRHIAHDEPLLRHVGPTDFGLVRQRMIVGQYNEDPLTPQMLGLTALPGPRSGYEGNVELQCPDSGDVLSRISLDGIDPDVRMKLPELSQEVEQKAGCERREDTDPDVPLFRSPDRSDIAGARVDMPEGIARRPQESLAGDRQADTSRVPLEQ